MTLLGQILGEVPEWVADGGSWVGFLVGLGTVIVLGYGFARWLRRSLIHAVGEVVDDKLEPIHVELVDAADAARLVRQELREHMQDSLNRSAEWRASVDTALRNLQQGQAPHTR